MTNTNKASSYCKIPWETILIEMNGDIYQCGCPAKVYKPIGNILDVNDGQSFWDLFKNNFFKKSILENNYAYCNEKVCGNLQNAMINGSDPIFLKSQSDLEKLQYLFIYLPIDASCNLACPSCRNGKIINKFNDEYYRAKKILEKVNEVILPNVPYPVFRLMGSGEVFASPAMLEWLSNFPFDQYLRSRFYIHTNGTLLHKHEEWLRKYEKRFHGFEISIDASNELTYTRTRINGNWKNLLQGIEIAKSLKTHAPLRFSFVINRRNYKEILDFINFADSYGVDAISFYKLDRWGHFTDEQWAIENIFDPAHVLFPDLLNELKKFPWDQSRLGHNLHYLKNML